MARPGVDVKFTIKGTGWHAAGHLKGSKGRLVDLEHVFDEIEKNHRYAPRTHEIKPPSPNTIDITMNGNVIEPARTRRLVQKDLFGGNVAIPEPRAEPPRTHPFTVKERDDYDGTMDELVPGVDLENTCGWCGKSLKGVEIIHECTYDGFSHDTEQCRDAMDDWLMDNVIDPEGEIHDLKGSKKAAGFTGDISDAQAGELHELKRP